MFFLLFRPLRAFPVQGIGTARIRSGQAHAAQGGVFFLQSDPQAIIFIIVTFFP